VSNSTEITAIHREIKNKLHELYAELFRHDGYGDLRLEIRILRRGQKEVIISCGKQYRYVIPFPDGNPRDRDGVGKPHGENGGHRADEKRESAAADPCVSSRLKTETGGN
jgi:hypothetical protein